MSCERATVGAVARAKGQSQGAGPGAGIIINSQGQIQSQGQALDTPPPENWERPGWMDGEMVPGAKAGG